MFLFLSLNRLYVAGDDGAKQTLGRASGEYRQTLSASVCTALQVRRPHARIQKSPAWRDSSNRALKYPACRGSLDELWLQAVAGRNRRGWGQGVCGRSSAPGWHSFNTWSALSMQVPQPAATPSSCCKLHKSRIPLAATSRICCSVIALQMQTYIGPTESNLMPYWSANENHCQYDSCKNVRLAGLWGMRGFGIVLRARRSGN